MLPLGSQLFNALGVARGKHKHCGIQVASLSLDPEERFKMDNLLLAGLARSSVYKTHGMARVFCGVDQDRVQHQEPNLAEDLRRLDAGVWITIPDEHGGMRRVRLRAWVLLVAADMLAANSLLPFMESTGAHLFCRQCDCDSRAAYANAAYSFVRPPAPEPGAAKSARPSGPSLRSWPMLKALLERCRSLSGKHLKKEFTENGINKRVFAFDPTYVPHVTPTDIAPQDILHLFPDGILRSECAWLFYILIKLGLDLRAVRHAVRACTSLPADVRVPDLHDDLKKGVKGGKPSAKAVMRMTGSQMMHFALHSQQILDPLLTPQMKAHPAWICWIKLVELFALVIQVRLEVSDVERIDNLVQEHSQLFDNVAEYEGLKRPKHHFAKHVAMDAWRYGPPRGYWCFGFEGFNKVIKKGASLSNWKSETVSIMKYWSLRSAHALKDAV